MLSLPCTTLKFLILASIDSFLSPLLIFFSFICDTFNILPGVYLETSRTNYFFILPKSMLYCHLLDFLVGYTATLLPALGTLFLLWSCLFSLNMKALALSDCILFYHVWLFFLGGLLFF